MKPRARLYALLPAWYRAQDASVGLDASGRAPIEAWLARVEQSFEALHAATSAAYDDWFVETCAPELLRAIGGLVGLELEGPALPGDRRLVANAIHRWRRKGSAWALWDALEGASGWRVELREFENELLATRATGYASARSEAWSTAEPKRPGRTTPALGASAGPSLRRIEVRVRRSFEVVVEDADPAALGDGWYAFDAGGLRCSVPEHDVRVRVRVDGAPVALHAADAALLEAWESTPEQPPSARQALLDAERGRFWLPEPPRESVRVDWVCRRPGPIGAGLPSEAASPFNAALPGAGRQRHEAASGVFRALVSRAFTDAELGSRCFRSLDAALAARPAGCDADVRVLDSGRYGSLVARLEPGCTLSLRSHPGELPCIAELHVEGALGLTGILVAGDVEVTGRAELHAASVRGRLALGGGRIARSLVGPVEVTCAAELQVRDSVIGDHRAYEARPRDGADARSLGGPHVDAIVLDARRSTFLGSVHVGEVSRAENCLFRGLLTIRRPHAGRFDHSPHPRGSRVAPDAERFAFEPDEAPRFASLAPTAAGYAVLLGPEALLRSASNGGEPGAFHALHAHARLARLERELERFLPAGFEASVELTP